MAHRFYSCSTKEMVMLLQNVAYAHPNGDVLFNDISVAIAPGSKVALIGNNGSGKSTLLKILAGQIQASAGYIVTESTPYYIPQLHDQFDELSVAQVLHVDAKIDAFHEILAGKANESNLLVLDDDWTIEERCAEALTRWEPSGIELNRLMGTLSGGQKTKVFLAGIAIHAPAIVMMDEPSNHLDTTSRNLLYNYIQFCSETLVVVSHDRLLLNMIDHIYELDKRGITLYGGNYDFYSEQKQAELDAAEHILKDKEKALRKAVDTEHDTAERRQRLDARGRKKQVKAGTPKIMLNTLRNSAEKSTSRLKEVHTEKISNLSQEASALRRELPMIRTMKLDIDTSNVHKDKLLFSAIGVNHLYGKDNLWQEPIDLEIFSGERIRIQGRNGSGKTTLIRIIVGSLLPTTGDVDRRSNQSVYIDQDYSILDDNITVYEQAGSFNTSGLEEHDIRIRLNRFLFDRHQMDTMCKDLSGGERMRLLLCCLTIQRKAPDIIILDEPTNNLDIQNIEIMTHAIKEYSGTLIVVSHDEYFIDEIDITRTIELSQYSL